MGRIDKGVAGSYLSRAAAVPVSPAGRPFQALFEDFMLGFSALAQRFFGSSNDRKIRPLMNRVPEINALEDRFKAMSDDELKAMTPAFKARLAEGEPLEDRLPEAL